jgi:hypothetical protein
MNAPTRLTDLVRFYKLLAALENKIGPHRKLGECSGRMDWPKRGVYFFFEDGEKRSHTGNGQRVVRVGTHALTTGSGTKLWSRLSQHRGQLNVWKEVGNVRFGSRVDGALARTF